MHNFLSRDFFQEGLTGGVNGAFKGGREGSTADNKRTSVARVSDSERSAYAQLEGRGFLRVTLKAVVRTV